MKTVIKVIKWVFIVTLSGLFAAVIGSFFDWPLWANILTFLGILLLAIFLEQLIRKAIYRYKTGFISEQNHQLLTQYTSWSRFKALQAVVAKQNPQHFKQLSSMPLTINFSINGASLFDAASQYSLNVSPRVDEQAAYWTLLDNLLILNPEQTVYQKTVSQRSWDKLLYNLKRFRNKTVVNSVVISVSLASLRREFDAAFTDRLLLIKQRIEQISQKTGYTVPVIMVVTDLQHLDHSDLLFKQMSELQKQQVFGGFASSKENSSLLAINQSIAKQLNERVDAVAIKQPSLPFNEYYQILNQFETFNNKLEQIDALLSTTNDSKNIATVGLFYTAQLNGDQQSANHYFCRDLLQHSLVHRHLHPVITLQGHSSERLKWNLRLLFFYGVYMLTMVYIIYSFIATNYNLKKLLVAIPHKVEYNNDLQHNIVKIENYNNLMDTVISYKNRWVVRAMPFHVGFKKLESKYLNQYVEQFHQHIFGLYLSATKTYLQQHNEQVMPVEHAFIIESLVQSLNLIQAKLDKQDYPYFNQLDTPELYIDGDSDNQNKILASYGELFQQYVWWEKDTQRLKSIRAEILNLISTYEFFSEDKTLNWVVEWANHIQTAKPTTLSSFWHGNKTEDNIKVGYAYTNQGQQRIEKLLKEVASTIPARYNIEVKRQQFAYWYNQQKVEHWHNFASQFHRGVHTLSYSSSWTRFFNSREMISNRGPYYALLDALFDQLAYIPESQRPIWLHQLDKFYGLLNYQVEKNKINKAVSITKAAKNFLHHITTRPSMKEREGHLNQLYKDQFDQELKAAQTFLDYQAELYKIYAKPSSSVGKAFTIATGIYNPSNRDAEAVKAIYAAQASYMRMQKLLSTEYENDTIFWTLLRGPIDFYVDYINRNASCYVQQQWVNKILKTTNGLKGDELTVTLFGKNGEAWKFANNYLNAFLLIDQDKYRPRIVSGHIFPFTDKFYTFMNSGLMIQAIDREQQQLQNDFNKNNGRLIDITTFPTKVNSTARQMPIKTEITTSCSGKQVSITNLNYIKRSQLQWQLGQCGPARLDVKFRGFTLTQYYGGKFGFAHLLRKFNEGKVILRPKDFNDQQLTMHENHIKWLKIRLNVSGLGQFATRLDRFFKLNAQLREHELSYLHNGNIPDNIAVCWNNQLLAKSFQQQNTPDSIQRQTIRHPSGKVN